MTVLFLVTACSLPRGAALQSEILSHDNDENPEMAVYSVTRDFLPILAAWPRTGTAGSTGWISHKHIGATSIIASGDKVNLIIWDNDENSLLTAPGQKVINIENITVSPNGTIFIPYLEHVKISGLSDEAARGKIQSQLADIIPSAQVQLTTTAGMNRSVSLVGGVSGPGTYPIIDPHFTVLNLISQGGGVSASLRNPHITLIRAGRTYRSSLDRIVKNPSLDSILKGGDKVIVQNDARFFRSLGAASNEQLIHFGSDRLSALDAMSLIGGISDSRANPKGILILREYPHKTIRSDNSGPGHARTIFVIDLTSSDGLFSAGRFEINSEDTVLVTESPLTTANTVFGLIGSIFGIASTIRD